LSSEPICGWIKYYTPDGVLATLPIPFGTPAEMLATAQAYAAAGWLKTEPGLNEGEHREAVGYVCRMVQVSRKDGSLVPKLALYPANDLTTYKFVQVYLNTADDQQSFERATGLALDDLPEWDGEAAPQRGNPRTDKYIVPVAQPCAAIVENNPKYEEGSKEQPKRRFKGWYGAAATVSVPAKETPEPDKPVSALAKTAPRKIEAAQVAAPAPASGGLSREQAVSLTAWATANNGDIRITGQEVLKALKVERLGEWAGSFEQAKSAILAWVAKRDAEIEW